MLSQIQLQLDPSNIIVAVLTFLIVLGGFVAWMTNNAVKTSEIRSICKGLASEFAGVKEWVETVHAELKELRSHHAHTRERIIKVETVLDHGVQIHQHGIKPQFRHPKLHPLQDSSDENDDETSKEI